MNSCILFLIVISLVLIPALTDDLFENSVSECRLRVDLMTMLPKDIQSRPVQGHNYTTNVEIVFVITHIAGLDERTETLTVSGWTFFKWNDDRLRWDPKQYEGVKRTRLAQNALWKPPLFLYNSASSAETFNSYGDVPVLVFYPGIIRWVPPFTSKSVCAVDLKWFPFDKHECFLEFGSWIYGGDEVNLTVRQFKAENILTDFTDVNNEWNVLSTSTDRHTYSPFSTWHTVRVYINLQRRATYYQYLLILPLLIGIFLCLLIFWVHSLFKFVIGSFNLFLLTLFICHIYWIIPRSGSSVPNILIICGNTFALTGVSILFSMITMILSHRTEPKIPDVVLNYLSGWLGVILCLRLPPTTLTVNAIANPSSDSLQMQISDNSTSGGKKEVKPWALLATALDRIFFIVFTFTFFIILIVAFNG